MTGSVLPLQSLWQNTLTKATGLGSEGRTCFSLQCKNMVHYGREVKSARAWISWHITPANRKQSDECLCPAHLLFLYSLGPQSGNGAIIFSVDLSVSINLANTVPHGHVQKLIPPVDLSSWQSTLTITCNNASPWIWIVPRICQPRQQGNLVLYLSHHVMLSATWEWHGHCHQSNINKRLMVKRLFSYS